MFRDLKIDSFYTSEDDVIKSFFRPVILEAVTYDRVSAYFSAGALAAYANELETFGFAGHKCRLIISKDISPYDFEQIKIGTYIRKSLLDEMLQDLRMINSFIVEKGLSNLARLIVLGFVEIKIAFKTKGIFHDKFGILEDSCGDIIKFVGSNNETTSALYDNHESFSVICSWLDKDGFYSSGIEKSRRIFESYWCGGFGQVVVRDIDDILLQEIIQHDKGSIVEEAVFLKEKTCVLDILDGRLYLQLNLPDNGDYLKSRGFIRGRLKKYLEKKGLEVFGKIIFKKDLEYVQYKEIHQLLQKYIPQYGYNYEVTERLQLLIEEKDVHIEERSTLGLDIKRRDSRLMKHFNEFSSIVKSQMKRSLRERQLWDAFFMTAMKKSANFSVPGSGKTSSALGMFAFLCKKKCIKRILVISPKNAFGSWKEEFKACFGEKEKLRVLSLHDLDKAFVHHELRYSLEKYNLLLFNYESLGNWEDDLCQSVINSETMLVFDEVHKIKNVRGKRAEVALRIAKNAKYVIVMTGTPIPNGYIDIYNMLHLMFPNEYRSFFGFKEYELIRPTDIERQEINKKLKPFYCRTTKEDLEVPPVESDKCINVNSTSIQNRLFYILKQVYGKKNMLAWLWRVLQVESDPRMLLRAINPADLIEVLDVDVDNIEDIDYQDYSQELSELVNSHQGLTPKMTAGIQLLQSLVNEGKSVICWCIFLHSIHSIKEELCGRGIKAEFIDGSIEQSEREKIINRFRKREFDVLITNPHTLAESVSLHSVCHDAVYLEYSYNLVHLLQSKDRIHRLGLKDGQYTQYYYVKEFFDYNGGEFSLDEKIYQRLCDKERLMLEAINDDCLENISTSDEDLEIILRDLL